MPTSIAEFNGVKRFSLTTLPALHPSLPLLSPHHSRALNYFEPQHIEVKMIVRHVVVVRPRLSGEFSLYSGGGIRGEEGSGNLCKGAWGQVG